MDNPSSPNGEYEGPVRQELNVRDLICRIAGGITVAWNALRRGETIATIKIPHGPLTFL